MFVRKFGNYDTNEASMESATFAEGESKTLQSEKENCDINVIVRRFRVTGELPVRAAMATYGDFEGIFDFQSAMNAVREAQESFDALPAEVRKRFHNDPQEFVEFCSEKENLPELRKMGLAVPEVEPEPEVIQKVEVVNPAPSA